MNLDKLVALGDEVRRLEAEYRQVAEGARQHRGELARLRAEREVDIDAPAAQLLAGSLADLVNLPAETLKAAGLSLPTVQAMLTAHRAAERLETERATLSKRLQDARRLHERCLTYARQKGASV